MAIPILFIHSAGVQEPGKGSMELIDNLRGQLEPNYRLICPDMPRPENPDYNSWKIQLEKQLDAIDDEVILIGHSLGGSVLLKYFSEVPHQKPITAIFTIASPLFGGIGWNADMFAPKPDFGSHLISIPKIFLYHSQDDDVVPFAHISEYARCIPQSRIRELDGYGHLFNKPCKPLIDDITSIKINATISVKPQKNMITNAISETVRTVTEDLVNILKEFGEDQINQIPFEGSWTAAQVADHLIKSDQGMPAIMTGKTTTTERKPDEKIVVLESIFLDFSNKYKARDFNTPGNGPFEKGQLIKKIEEIREKIVRIAATEDLIATCTEWSFPGSGKLTRWELIHLVIFHSTRHTRQLKNIKVIMSGDPESL